MSTSGSGSAFSSFYGSSSSNNNNNNSSSSNNGGSENANTGMDLDSATGGTGTAGGDQNTTGVEIQAGEEERDADGFLRGAGSNGSNDGSTMFGRPEFDDVFYDNGGTGEIEGFEEALAAQLRHDQQREHQQQQQAEGAQGEGGFVNDEEDLTDEDYDNHHGEEDSPDANNANSNTVSFHQYEDDEEYASPYEDEDDEDELYGEEEIVVLDHVDPNDNPHADCIVSNLGMKSPAIREMNENEIYAKQAGLRYSSHGYDVQSEIGSVVSAGDHVNNLNTSGISALSSDGAGHHADNMVAYPFAFSPANGANGTNQNTPRPVGGRIGGFFSNIIFGRHGKGQGHNDYDGEGYPNDHHIDGDDGMLSEGSGDIQFDLHGNALPPNAAYLRRSFGNGSDGDNLDQLRLLAGQLHADWAGDQELMGPALARRLRDFQFAQEKRRKKYGNERPWGILGLYDHLASVRMDVEWAEDAAWRRANGEPYCAWAEFEASKNDGWNRPFFTYFILIVCTGVLIASIGVNGWVVEPININPMIGPSAETLVRMGAKETFLIVNENQAWRLVSPMVLHAGLIHFFLNMLALWFIGSAVEQSHGFIPALVLFIIPAIGGTVLSAIFLPEYISVGASGGIFGLIGACLSDIVMNWSLLFSNFVNEGGSKKRHAVVLLLLFLDIVVNCLLGLTPFVDNFTHLGGMLFGFLCGLSTMERVSSDFFGVEEQKCWSTFKNIFTRFFGLIVSIGCIMAATIILLEGDGVTNPCEACSTLSCVPFPPWSPQDDKWWYCDDCGSVTADARVNPATGVFTKLDMTCPDGSTQVIDLEDMEEKDKAWLEKNLPNFCRKHCPTTTKS